MPTFPKAVSYIWRSYLRLRRRVAPGFAGVSPIGWQDIDAFIRRSGVRLAPWEIEIIEALDDLYMQPAPLPTAPEGQAVVVAASARDGAGVRSVLSGIAPRRTVNRKKGG